MSDALKVQSGGKEELDKVGREHSEKLQTLARSLLSNLYMLVRSVKMYDPDNAVFTKPLVLLQETLNQIIAKEGHVDLVTVRDSFYLNNMLVKVDLNALDNVRFLAAELKGKDVGGLLLQRPVQIDELKNFIWVFSKDSVGPAPEDGIAGRKLVNIRLAKYTQLKEKLQGDQLQNPGDQKVDRKKYAMVVYGRAIIYLTKYLESLQKGKPIGTGPALRVVQDLVDICYEQRVHFLGMTTLKKDEDYLLYHQVNVCLSAIVFGQELGLTKPQLRDLGYAALFHDSGMAMLPDAIRLKKGALTPEEKALVQKAPLISIRNILMERGLTRTALLRVVTTSEHKTDFGTPVWDAHGQLQMIIPKSNLSVYARIIAICAAYDSLTSKRPYRDAYGPEVALTLMWTEMRAKFDPDLLKVFMKVMAIQPVKILTRRQQRLSIGGGL